MFYNFAKFVCSLLINLLFKIQVEGLEFFPEKGAAIVFSNHKSWWDPIIVGCILKRPVFFMAKKELFKIPVFGFLLRKLNAFPVNRGAPDRKAIKKALEILNDKKVLGIFPEGTRSKDGSLKEPEPGIALLAAKVKEVALVPVAITGDYRFFSLITVRIGRPMRLSLKEEAKLNSKKLTEISRAIFNEVSKLLLD
ncbi:lysophospholipid acyltransferase family protein [Thermosediminibacter oceani]|uniref:1-acyl-sn-glycerol-3-phosphate acyltransferase n=1 Tax=Thermosediminibacter oceani (strain ATCC BAA-1034 / DSM 16646 / JW/IW-1228P) TaxID=555079 RepID=D9S3D9_THEOJ|nr:lysophospholipid acyltransferase family protein [Thermosediminibacter oceani]ADL07916.1 1-acyl-sn-glycerol-3-phosphate acyltransferase [Thermosediminibacter oceani DSM 16646]